MRSVSKLTAVAVLLASCGGGGTDVSPAPPPPPPPPPPAPVASLVLSRDSATVLIGATMQLAATLKDAQGATLTGRTVNWSTTTPGVASVSGTGLVTAVQVGQSKIVALAEGKSDTAVIVVPPAPVQISLQGAASQTATIGPAGGTIVATGAGGIQYTLTIPALALLQPVAISMTPLGSVTGLPLSGGFVAGADFAPAGLVFAQPATLTISTSPTPGANQHLVGFTYQGTGSALALAPAKGGANSITLPVLHFSGIGAGFGTTQDLEAIWTGSNPGVSSGATFVNALITESAKNPPSGGFMLQVLEDWFDAIILPQVAAASTDVQLLSAISARNDWEDTPELLGVFAAIPGHELAPSLQVRRDQWLQVFAAKVKRAIEGNLQLCAGPGLASARIAALDNALFWYRMADFGWSIATAQYGLDLAWFQANLCARSVSDNIVLPDPLHNGTNTLDVTFKLVFTGGQLIMGANFWVAATASGASLGLPGATALNPPGFYSGGVTPIGSSGSVTLDLTACYAGSLPSSQLRFDEICHTEHIVRDRVPPPVPSLAGTYSVAFWETDLVTGLEVSRSVARSMPFFRVNGSADWCLDATGGTSCAAGIWRGTLTDLTFVATRPSDGCSLTITFNGFFHPSLGGSGCPRPPSGVTPNGTLLHLSGVWISP